MANTFLRVTATNVRFVKTKAPCANYLLLRERHVEARRFLALN